MIASPPHARPFLSLVGGLFVAVSVGALGCHKATEAECEEIVDRMVELELRGQGVSDPQTLATRKAEAKARKRDELVRGCVGKRISQGALGCIRSAKTSDEITEKCLR